MLENITGGISVIAKRGGGGLWQRHQAVASAASAGRDLPLRR